MSTDSTAQTGWLAQLWYRVIFLGLGRHHTRLRQLPDRTVGESRKADSVADNARPCCPRAFGGNSVFDVPTVGIL